MKLSSSCTRVHCLKSIYLRDIIYNNNNFNNDSAYGDTENGKLAAAGRAGAMRAFSPGRDRRRHEGAADAV